MDEIRDRKDRHRPAGAQLTVIYDGECGLCTRSVEALSRWDRERVLEFVPYQAAGVTSRFPWISDEEFSRAIQVVGSEGETWAGSRGLEEILRALRPSGVLALPFRVPGARRLAQTVYGWVARNRRHLGCSRHCSL